MYLIHGVDFNKMNLIRIKQQIIKFLEWKLCTYFITNLNSYFIISAVDCISIYTIIEI